MNLRVDEWCFAGSDPVAAVNRECLTLDNGREQHVCSTSERDMSDSFTPFDTVVN